MQIRIKKDKEDKVLEFVTTAISLLEPNSTTLAGGNAHNFEYKFEQYVYALSNLIKIPGIKNFNDAQLIIRNAIQKLKNYSLTLDNFKTCLNEARREALDKPTKKYYFVFPLKIKYNSLKKRKITLLDTEIKVCSYKYIQKNFSYEELKQKAEHDTRIKEGIKEGLEPSRTYFVIEEYAIDEDRARHSASDKFELLRSIINFVDQYGRLHKHFGVPTSLSLIHPPKVFFAFDSNRTYLNMWMTNITYTGEIDFDSDILKSRKVIERSEKLIKKINSLKNGGLRDLIIEALYRHNNALDYYDKKWLSFLSFWQIFELITLSSKYNLKQDEVCKRMLSLLKEKDPYEDIIDVFKKKRNKFVHEAELRDFTENDINMIKGIAQEAIIFLIYDASNLKDIGGLDFFYRNIHTSGEGFKIKTDILKYIGKIKNV